MKSKKKNKQKTNPSIYQIEARESDYLYINNSQIPNTGKGLYTAIPIMKDEIISLYKGEILSYEEANERAEKGHDQYFIDTLDGNIMDSMHVKCFAKYANDTKGFVKTNFKLNSEITLDEDNNVCLVAKRDIDSGEEIFCSYGKTYWKEYEKKLLLTQKEKLS
jgi:SET domain-containing protein